MVNIRCENLKIVYSSGEKVAITDWGDGTITFLVNGSDVASYNFGHLSLDDYEFLIHDFFPGQNIPFRPDQFIPHE